jgi:hypothetical protein
VVILLVNGSCKEFIVGKLTIVPILVMVCMLQKRLPDILPAAESPGMQQSTQEDSVKTGRSRSNGREMESAPPSYATTASHQTLT